jgi:hypothetical protein
MVRHSLWVTILSSLADTVVPRGTLQVSDRTSGLSTATNAARKAHCEGAITDRAYAQSGPEGVESKRAATRLR